MSKPRIVQAPKDRFPYLLCSLLVGTSLWSPRTLIADEPITPIPAIQAEIRAVGYATELQKLETHVKNLRKMGGEDLQILIPQMLYYDMQIQKGTTDDRDAIAVMRLSKILHPEPHQIRKALVPLLEKKDVLMRKHVYEWLEGVDFGPRSDFTHYREMILAKRNNPPSGLIAYMFDTSPKDALLMCGQVYLVLASRSEEWRSVMWAEHVVGIAQWRKQHRFVKKTDVEAARQELEKLSQHGGWYARRYVAEILKRAPDFGTPQILERLKKDTHPLVREAVAEIK